VPVTVAAWANVAEKRSVAAEERRRDAFMMSCFVL
jgi:hypothetical protein